MIAMLCVFGVARLSAQQSQNQPQQVQGQPLAQQGQTAPPVPSPTAQQNPQPHPAQPALTQPCTPKTTSEAGKRFNWKPPKALQQIWDKSRKTLQDKTGVDIGSVRTDDTAKAASTPCPVPAPTPPAATPTTQTQ